MIIAPSIPYVAPHTDLDKFIVAKDYIKCLAKVERELSSSTIDPSDTSIPLAIRVSASNPHRRKGRTSTNVYDPNRVMEYPDHASAIIPATNGAFWAVFPAQAIDSASGSSAVLDSVWYYPQGAQGITDGIHLGSYENGCYRTCPDGYVVFDMNSSPVPSVSVLRNNHPSGATYLNLRLKVTDYQEAFDDLGLDTTNFAQNMERFGVPVTDADGAMVDVLVCCGGYYWNYDSSYGGAYFIPSNTLRLFVASTGIVQTFDADGSKVVNIADTPSSSLTETIVIPSYDPDWIMIPQYPFPIGSTVAETNYRGEIVVAGGVYLENVYDRYGGNKNQWAKRGEDLETEEYPASRLQVTVGIKSVERKSPTTGNTAQKYYRLFADVTTSGLNPRQIAYADGTKVMPLNPITTKGVEPLKDSKDGYFSQNRAPVMYPAVYSVKNGMLMYGGEFYATDKPRDFRGDKFPPDGRISGLNHLLNHLEAADLAKENPEKIVYNVPLLSCHAATFNLEGHYPKLNWLPMNISGAHGIAEGAVAIPYRNSIILVGGAQTEYTLTVGGISHPYNTEDLAKYTKPWADIKQITNPEFTADKIKNITFFGKKVLPTSTTTVPFKLTIDCLRYDCLYSHAVQLGLSDFFVLPTSVLKYDPIPGTHRTNATLIRRRLPLNWKSKTLMGLTEVHRLWRCYANMYVSEVVGLPVIHEGPDKFQEETPYWYGHANPVKGSLGSITVREDEEYWLYYLGNGDKPARYFQIKILTTAKALHARGGGTGQTALDTEAGHITYTNRVLGPRAWDRDPRSPNGGMSD